MKQLLRQLIVLGLVGSLCSCAHLSKDAKRKQSLDYMDAAKSLMTTNQYREALRELLEAERLDPNNKEVQYLLASVYFFGFRRHADATAHIEKALKLAKESYPEADNLFGVVLLDQNKPQDAIVYFNRAAKDLLYITPYFAEQNLGDAYTQLGNLPEANAHYRQAIMLQPNLCGAYLPLAKNLHQLKKLKEAEISLLGFIKNCDNERLQKYVPPSLVASAYYELGLIRLDAKNQEGAKEAFFSCSQRFGNEEIARKCFSKSKQ